VARCLTYKSTRNDIHKLDNIVQVMDNPKEFSIEQVYVEAVGDRMQDIGIHLQLT